jgi:NAD(P)-dependent dehydrogenase (short-subunit alcohol dehydrogenase family)
MTKLELEGRVALVTGGASGIGLASAAAFAAEGASVIIADRDGDAAEAAARSVRASGGQAAAYRVDVSSLAELRGLFDYVGETHGKLHVLFSHAGIQGPLGMDITEEQFDHVIAVNLKSHFFATNYAIPLMRLAAPHASIIYTSSTGGLRAGALSPLYGTTKAAILMLMRTVARQYGPDGVRANAICPGPVETPFSREFSRMAGRDEAAYRRGLEARGQSIPLGRVGQPDDVAGTTVFLASDKSMYLTGVSITVDGGMTA